MRSMSTKWPAIGRILAICALLWAPAGSEAGAQQPDRWYLSAGLGMDWASLMRQAGDNRDRTCYPDMDCRYLPNGMPEGYRWYYDLEPGTGLAFEFAFGRVFDHMRMELSAGQRKQNLDQRFVAITFLNGGSIREAVNDVRSNAMASIGDLTTRTYSLNGYYDFPIRYRGVTPYVGAGLGISSLVVSELHYSASYTGTQGPDDPPLASFNNMQEVDLSDLSLAKSLYAGADYFLGGGILLGLKLTYTGVGDLDDRSEYALHRMAGLTNETNVSRTDHWSVTATFRLLLPN